MFDSRVTRAAYSQSAYQNILGKTCPELQPIGSTTKKSGSSLGCDTYMLRPQQSEAFTIKENEAVFYLALPAACCPGAVSPVQLVHGNLVDQNAQFSVFAKGIIWGKHFCLI